MNGQPNTSPLIRDYDQGGFTIGDDFHPGSVLINGEEGEGFSIQSWPVNDPEALTVTDFTILLESPQRPDLILLGVGEQMNHPFAKLRMAMTGAGIPLEVQSTPAICRTWNLLLSEGRRVALAAIPLGQKEALENNS
ncbi:MAG: hypothetical protein CNE91_01565 [SAR116 cluster bacterium MED-G04]|nr:MAG: hypothetical protein CNE91_01565 [SAR116 cluster bacterium MED-G04]CAI8346376.1 MAG: Uncharacterised protein [SAR116 cluster bacterium MED-G04]|tara:strand:+ start:721 stop:1131 length:411 start_codon:yes stop_codon:yes gene_type:complete